MYRESVINPMAIAALRRTTTSRYRKHAIGIKLKNACGFSGERGVCRTCGVIHEEGRGRPVSSGTFQERGARLLVWSPFCRIRLVRTFVGAASQRTHLNTVRKDSHQRVLGVIYCRASGFVKKRSGFSPPTCFTMSGQNDPPRTH